MENKILIGEVSRYFNISKQTLIHYDRIGLLHPSVIENNGYRYYTFEDIDKLDVILSLKDAGLKLSEIGKYLENPSLEESLKLLKVQNNILEKKIEKLQKTQKKLHHKIEEIKYINQNDFFNDIRLIEKKERYVLYEDIDFTCPDINSFPDAMGLLRERMDKKECYFKYLHSLVGVFVDNKNFEKGIFSELFRLFVFIDEYKNQSNELVLKKGLYVCIQHHGLFENTHISYKKALEFIDKHKLEITGNSIEIPLLSSWSVKSEDEYRTELQIPVKKKEQSV
ncbi:MAG: MerR family transcriptional regulator [Firmicutes bacterium]|jgi:DNA-binding transcriptional MerR regulator|nr:MerR family transcriptional regulator [Bacillota bacterium]